MPELTPFERLQPCLLDRLTDEDPKSVQESRSQRVISLPRYREAVLRDLRWLLNSHCHLASEGLDEFPEAAQSVLNFGIRDLCGLLSSSLNLTELERHLVNRIQLFEPRILRQTLTVRVLERESDKSNPSVVAFEISGLLWAQPMPEQLLIKTEIDLETGQCAF